MKNISYIYLLVFLLCACKRDVTPPAKNISSFIPEVLRAFSGEKVQDSFINCWGRYYPNKNLIIYNYVWNNTGYGGHEVVLLYYPPTQDVLMLQPLCDVDSNSIKNLQNNLYLFINKNKIKLTSKEFIEIFAPITLPFQSAYTLYSFHHPSTLTRVERPNVDSCTIIMHGLPFRYQPVLPSTHKACIAGLYPRSFLALETQIHHDFAPNTYYMSLRWSGFCNKYGEENEPLFVVVVDKKNSNKFKYYEQRNID